MTAQKTAAGETKGRGGGIIFIYLTFSVACCWKVHVRVHKMYALMHVYVCCFSW